MGTLVFDFKDSREDIRDFPDGWYQATIVESKPTQSSSGNDQAQLTLEIEHPSVGKARLLDWINPAFEPRAKAFLRAFYGFTPEEFRDAIASGGGSLSLHPSDLKNGVVLVYLGTGVNLKGEPRRETKAPYYAPVSQRELLNWQK